MALVAQKLSALNALATQQTQIEATVSNYLRKVPPGSMTLTGVCLKTRSKSNTKDGRSWTTHSATIMVLNIDDPGHYPCKDGNGGYIVRARVPDPVKSSAKKKVFYSPEDTDPKHRKNYRVRPGDVIRIKTQGGTRYPADCTNNICIIKMSGVVIDFVAAHEVVNQENGEKKMVDDAYYFQGLPPVSVKSKFNVKQARKLFNTHLSPLFRQIPADLNTNPNASVLISIDGQGGETLSNKRFLPLLEKDGLCAATLLALPHKSQFGDPEKMLSWKVEDNSELSMPKLQLVLTHYNKIPGFGHEVIAVASTLWQEHVSKILTCSAEKWIELGDVVIPHIAKYLTLFTYKGKDSELEGKNRMGDDPNSGGAVQLQVSKMIFDFDGFMNELKNQGILIQVSRKTFITACFRDKKSVKGTVKSVTATKWESIERVAGCQEKEILKSEFKDSPYVKEHGWHNAWEEDHKSIEHGIPPEDGKTTYYVLHNAIFPGQTRHKWDLWGDAAKAEAGDDGEEQGEEDGEDEGFEEQSTNPNLEPFSDVETQIAAKMSDDDKVMSMIRPHTDKDLKEKFRPKTRNGLVQPFVCMPFYHDETVAAMTDELSQDVIELIQAVNANQPKNPDPARYRNRYRYELQENLVQSVPPTKEESKSDGKELLALPPATGEGDKKRKREDDGDAGDDTPPVKREKEADGDAATQSMDTGDDNAGEGEDDGNSGGDDDGGEGGEDAGGDEGDDLDELEGM